MSTGRTHFEIFNAASVPLMFCQSLATLSDQQPTVQGFGSLLRGHTPGLVVRTALPSQVAHVETLPGRVYGVTDEAGAVNLTIIYAGSPAVGEVLVTYSDGSGGQKGTPTLTFQAAVTGYQIEKHELPTSYDEVFDAIYV